MVCTLPPPWLIANASTAASPPAQPNQNPAGCRSFVRSTESAAVAAGTTPTTTAAWAAGTRSTAIVEQQRKADRESQGHHRERNEVRAAGMRHVAHDSQRRPGEQRGDDDARERQRLRTEGRRRYTGRRCRATEAQHARCAPCDAGGGDLVTARSSGSTPACRIRCARTCWRLPQRSLAHAAPPSGARGVDEEKRAVRSGAFAQARDGRPCEQVDRVPRHARKCRGRRIRGPGDPGHQL